MKGISPNHVAVIMDGNGRWANKQNKPRSFGHRIGVNRVMDIIRWSIDAKVSHLTLFALSSENKQRPPKEVTHILQLLGVSLERYQSLLMEHGVRVCFLGDLQFLSPSLRAKCEQLTSKTTQNDTLIVNIALNYGGQWHIQSCVQHFIAQGVPAAEVTSEALNAFFMPAHCPAIDLLIRTGAVHRISNFMLWHLSYAELYFSALHWPEFTEQEFKSALAFFADAQRRFGLLSPSQAVVSESSHD